MVIVLNMENGDLISMDAASGNLERGEHAVLACPAAQPCPPMQGKQYVMPALMEHDFTAPG